jgi:hypothetical protein
MLEEQIENDMVAFKKETADNDLHSQSREQDRTFKSLPKHHEGASTPF